MNMLEYPTTKLPTTLRIVFTLLLIIFCIEALVMVVLPILLAQADEQVRNLADSLLLAALSAPFIWLIIARPLRTAAMNESSMTRAVLADMVDAVISFDEKGAIETLNPAAVKMFGYGAEEMVGVKIDRIVAGIASGAAAALQVREESLKDAEITGCRRDGTSFPAQVSVSHIRLDRRRICIAIIHDVSERKRYEEELEYQASHDGLTGLPNRNLLGDRLRQSLLVARRSRQQVAVFLVGLDHFKFINDTLGHDVGDRLLKSVAERLTGCVRAEDTVARLDSDKFAIVAADLAAEEHAALVAGKVRETVSRSHRIGEHDLDVTGCIGISIFPRDGEDGQALLKNADTAMHRAKEKGYGSICFYTGEMNERSVARLSMEKHLRRALERNELSLHYQPKVNLHSGLITGMEALLRWQSPELGPVSPANFIPLAEETGLIEPIGEWVIRTACAQNKAWQDANLISLTVAVNLSARQFRQNNMIGIIEGILLETGLDPSFLELEITESLVMHNVEWVTDTLRRLKEMGVSLTMDDFGTGYSSLGYLKRFPFDKLKIDQSFVRDITSDPDSAAIARTVIAMAHSLHLKVIAEGVETIGQLNYLRLHDCDEMQGYYFSRPVAAEEFTRMLGEGGRMEVSADNSRRAGKMILIVDDEKNVAAALKRAISLDGYQVLTANSAAEGFELLANNEVAVVLSDQRMPGMSGSEFLGRVKELYPGTVRIVLTGYADLNSVTDAINCGAIYKFLTKPWRDDVIRERVAEAVRYHESLAGTA